MGDRLRTGVTYKGLAMIQARLRIGSEEEKSDRKGIEKAGSTELAADRVDGGGGR